MARSGLFLVIMLILSTSVNALEPVNAQDVDAVCKSVARKLSSVYLSDCKPGRFKASGGHSVKQRLIPLKEYPPMKQRKPKGRILLIGGIHGDEYSSVSIIFKWMNILDKHHSGLFHWKVVPVLNPDGLLLKKSQRMNINGVDLNRNFPTPDWHTESVRYWEQRTRRNPRRYPGEAPLSEPESRWLAREIERFQPHVVVSVHAPHGIVDFDGPHKAPNKLGHLYLNLLGTYPGSLGNYAGVQRRLPVITIELPYAGIMPSKRETRAIWIDLIRWLNNNVGKQAPVWTPREKPVLTRSGNFISDVFAHESKSPDPTSSTAVPEVK